MRQPSDDPGCKYAAGRPQDDQTALIPEPRAITGCVAKCGRRVRQLRLGGLHRGPAGDGPVDGAVCIQLVHICFKHVIDSRTGDRQCARL